MKLARSKLDSFIDYPIFRALRLAFKNEIEGKIQCRIYEQIPKLICTIFAHPICSMFP